MNAQYNVISCLGFRYPLDLDKETIAYLDNLLTRIILDTNSEVVSLSLPPLPINNKDSVSRKMSQNRSPDVVVTPAVPLTKETHDNLSRF